MALQTMICEAIMTPEASVTSGSGALELAHPEVLTKHMRVHVLLVRIAEAALLARVRLLT